MGNIVMLVMIVVIFYFFMIRPQMKKQKELKKFRENLKVGDKIVTIGGLHGKILEMGDTSVLIAIETGKLRIDKTAISYSNEDKLVAR